MSRPSRGLALGVAIFLVATACHSIDEDAWAHGPVGLDVLPLREPLTYTGGPQANQPVPAQRGLLASYFNGAQYVDPAHQEYLVFQRVDPNIDFSWDGSDTNPVIPPDQGGIDHNDGDPRLPDHWAIWSVVWEGYLDVPGDGFYQLRLHVNNGGWLQMKDAAGVLMTVIDCAGGTSFEGDCDSAQLTLAAGRQYIRVSYYNNSPPLGVARLLWKGPATAFETVPSTSLFTTAQVGTTAATVSAGGNITLVQGAYLTRFGSFVDDDLNDSWTGTVDWGEGAGAQPLALFGLKTFFLSHQYIHVREQPYLVVVAITDSFGNLGLSQFAVTVIKPPLPASTRSVYITTNNLGPIGKQQALDMKERGLKNGLVALAFGKADKVTSPAGDRYGAVGWGAVNFQDIATITTEVKDYIEAFYNAAEDDAFLEIAIGTSNCTNADCYFKSETNFEHGKRWAQMVAAVNQWIFDQKFRSKVFAAGAIDLELAWSTPARAKDWVAGYVSVPGGLFYDFGDAGGCPGTMPTDDVDRGCANGWKLSDVAAVSWHTLGAWPMPEIYREDGLQARQWRAVSLWHFYKYGEPVPFSVIMTQEAACNGACSHPSLPPGFSTGNSPEMAWDFMVGALNANDITAGTLDSLRYETDIDRP